MSDETDRIRVYVSPLHAYDRDSGAPWQVEVEGRELAVLVIEYEQLAIEERGGWYPSGAAVKAERAFLEACGFSQRFDPSRGAERWRSAYYLNAHERQVAIEAGATLQTWRELAEDVLIPKLHQFKREGTAT